MIEVIGPYKVEREIGRGSMGVVYLARDARLDRDVAIKALPEEFARDVDRLGRFQSEAKVLASLNHPHIAQIYGIEEVDGRTFLVLEYVEGETLDVRLKRGPMSLEVALPVAVQIAEALEAAHEKGIIHRDLKPANIKFTESGQIKVLDFGLAKAMADDVVRPEHDSLSPTVLPAHTPTIPGVILGTAGYMSPEQARGKPVDQRTDLFSFGCVLYEMLTGLRPFVGETISDAIAAVLHCEPDLTALPAQTSPLIRLLISRSLAKDQRSRIHHMADIRVLFASVDDLGAPQPVASTHTPHVRAFSIDAATCRQFHRDAFDPRLIGHEMQYAENSASPDVLVLLVHGNGLDHTRWLDVLEKSPYRTVAPTQVGFEPSVPFRLRLPMRDQVILHRVFLRRMQERLRPGMTIVLGFSSGADLAMRMAADPGEVPPIDGMIALECNTSTRTHHITSHLSQLEPGDESALLRRLSEFGGTVESLEQWIMLHDYLVQLIGKMHNDIGVIRDFVIDIMAPFAVGGPSPFITWYREASRRVSELRCVVCEGDDYHRDIQSIRLDHLDSNCLGDHYRDESIVVAPGISHINLQESSRVLSYIDEVVLALKNRSGSRDTHGRARSDEEQVRIDR